MKADNLLKKYTFWNDVDNQFTKTIDFSKTNVVEVSEKSTQAGYIDSAENKKLFNYIFKFYALNEVLSSYREKQNGIIQEEDLALYKEYQDFSNDFSKRIFSFILYACVAEARHSYFVDEKSEDDRYSDTYREALVSHYLDYTMEELKNGKESELESFIDNLKEDMTDEEFKEYWEKLKTTPDLLRANFAEYLWNNSEVPDDIPYSIREPFDTEYYSKENKAKKLFDNFYKANEIKDKEKFKDLFEFLIDVNNQEYNGDGGSLQRELLMNDTLKHSNISHFTIEDLLENLSIFFIDGFNSGYGGEPWAEIARHGLDFARGKINSEMFIDRALSLEHNNGQMFNKNFIFSEYLPESTFGYSVEQNSHILRQSIVRQRFNMSIVDVLLNLQNSSSVLSLARFKNAEWASLTKDITDKDFKTLHNDFDHKHFENLKDNLYTLKEFTEVIEDLDRMIEIANKNGYPIPEFNFTNLVLTGLEKKNRNYDQERLEQNTTFSDFFSKIINGNLMNVEHKIDLSKFIKQPVFECHNLNLNTAKSLTKELIGGKAFGLTELINKGFNVPKAMVFDTQTCLSYLANPKFFQKNYKKINTAISEYLVDDNNNPLLVSVRSGAPVSMPGMMDSILNVGIDDSTYPKLCKMYSKEMINECVFSFMHQFCSSKLGLEIKFPKNFNKALDKFAEILIKNDIPCDRLKLFPLNKEAQVKLCVEAVFDSWNSPRAIAWRNEKQIPHDMGTAATIQKMIFGNKNENSLTSVIFSRDCITGTPELMGEYLIKAQGEDLVSGRRTPLPIQELKTTRPDIYKQIEYIAKVLEVDHKAIQDLEITVEDGKVYLLQMRNAVVSPDAQLSLAKELNLNLLDIVQPKNLIGDVKVDTNQEPEFKGLAASPGLISGIIVKDDADIINYKPLGKPLIFFSNQALPEHAPIMIATDAFITEFGGATSHAAILARSMGKPCVVGINKQDIESGTIVTMDAINGKIWKGELPIIVNQDNAINLSKKLLKENNIEINENLTPGTFSLSSWTTELSNFNIIEKTENNKNKMFLNIAQKTALALKLEHNKKTNKI